MLSKIEPSDNRVKALMLVEAKTNVRIRRSTIPTAR